LLVLTFTKKTVPIGIIVKITKTDPRTKIRVCKALIVSGARSA